MGFNRPEAKRLAKAAMRNTNPNPMLVTLVFVLLTTGVSYLVGLVLTNPIYDALYTAYLYLLDGAYDPMFIFKSLLSPGMVAVYMLVSLLLNVYFWVMNFGYASYALRMARGEQPGYRRLFDGFAALGRAILVSLLTSIFLSLWGLLFMVPYMVVMILAALLGSMGLMMLAILLLILCFIMFRPEKKAVPSASTYIPGKYGASLTLGNEHVNVEVTVDADQILDVSLVHLNEAVSTMYPLMQPSMNELAPQILNTQSTKDLTFPESSRYTCMTLLKAVDNALEKARE